MKKQSFFFILICLGTCFFSVESFSQVFVSKETAKIQLKRYNRTIRKTHTPIQRGNLSQAIWFDTATLRLLAQTVLGPKKTFDGIRIYMMAYETNDSGQRKNKKHPSSLIIVPTNGRDTIAIKGKTRYHLDNWDVLIKNPELIKKAELESKGKSKFEGLNHGELCPDNCLGTLYSEN